SDGNTEDLFTVAASDKDLQFIFSRVCVSDVCDGQRSSLMIQLQSVSESLFTLIICTDLTLISTDLCDASASKIPFNLFLLVCLNTSV
ncbi:hypothetical protein PO909_028107, partial [Leuciscus waleckii]